MKTDETLDVIKWNAATGKIEAVNRWATGWQVLVFNGWSHFATTHENMTGQKPTGQNLKPTASYSRKFPITT